MYLSLFVDADRRANLEDSFLHIHSQDDRVAFSEGRDLFQNARENGLLPFPFPALLLHCGDMVVEELGQVVDDVGCEDLYPVLFCELLSIGEHLYVKHKQAGVLLFPSFGDLRKQRLHGFDDILLGNWPNRNVRDGNALALQILQQGFQRTKRGGRNPHSHILQSELLLNVGELILAYCNGFLDFLSRIGHDERTAGNSLVQSIGCNFDSVGCKYGVVVDVLVFDPHFLHRMWGEESLDFRHNRSLKSEQDNLVFLVHDSVNQQAVDRGAVTFDHLDLHDCALEDVFFDCYAALDRLVCQAGLNDQRKQIGNAFSSDPRSRNQGDVLIWVLILPVHCSIVALFVQLESNFLEFGLVVVDGFLALRFQ